MTFNEANAWWNNLLLTPGIHQIKMYPVLALAVAAACHCPHSIYGKADKWELLQDALERLIEYNREKHHG